jgi:hypothetical protein
MTNEQKAATGKFGRKVGNGFVLETLFVDNELLIKMRSVSKNYKPEDSMISVMYGSNKKHVNKKYIHIYTPILKRGKIKNTHYCTVAELLEFLRIYKPRFDKDREAYARFTDWCLQIFREKEEKKVVRKQSWNITIEHYDDGTCQLIRTNDGFNAIELLGLTTNAQYDIMQQLRGQVQVDNVIRNVVESDDN